MDAILFSDDGQNDLSIVPEGIDEAGSLFFEVVGILRSIDFYLARCSNKPQVHPNDPRRRRERNFVKGRVHDGVR